MLMNKAKVDTYTLLLESSATVGFSSRLYALSIHCLVQFHWFETLDKCISYINLETLTIRMGMTLQIDTCSSSLV